MEKLFLLLLFSLAFGYEPKVQKYITSFIEDSNGKITNYDFRFLDIKIDFLEYSTSLKDEENEIGLCETFLFSSNKVTFDKTWWKSITDIEKWGLVYHELGHCICNLEHTAETDVLNIIKPYLSDGCPNDLMHPYNISYKCLNIHKEYYRKHLLNKCVKIEKSPYVLKIKD